jgi:hypothetical protein
MKRLIFWAILAVLFHSSAFPATGGKGAGSHTSAQSARSPVSGGGTTRGGGGGMARMAEQRKVPPLAEDRKINEQDCSKPVDWSAGNLKCK